ncbi:MAG: hypothetical protein DCF20_12725 [Pseudanabaena sp.]|nr:MAG: hypothetical protein DCF20_12725 [Pseudanabaena sp.]
MNFPMIKTVPQTKKIFSKESQALTHELKNKILELDLSLPNFSQQIDSIISTIKLIQDAATKANFNIRSSPFAEITSNLEASINMFRDRRADLDWVAKELLIEVINISNQVINEYCLGIDLAKDWVEIQQNLFSQVNEHLQLETNETLSQRYLELNDRTNELSNIEDKPEDLHLFDIDFGVDSDLADQDVYYENPTEEIDNPEVNLITQTGQLDDYLNFSESPQDLLGGSIDELEKLFPRLFEDSPEWDLDGLIENLNESSNQERLPMPELLAEIFSQSSEQLQGSEDETEIQGTKWNEQDLAEEKDIREDGDAWSKFTIMDSWTRTNDEELVPAFDLSDFDLSNDDKAVDEPLVNFFESLDHITSRLDSAQNLQAPKTTSPNPDNSSTLAEVLKEDFPASDIDTAIEESPIYQNNPDNFDSSWQDLSIIDFGDKEISFADFSALPIVAKSEMDLSRKSDVLIAARGNDGAIRIPLNHLEMLGDLSEELLVRKGSLDIYLNEIKSLSEEAQKQLQLLETNSNSQNQTAIAGIQNAVEQIDNVLALTEQQADAMSQDVYHLRKNLRQVLKHPISSLVRRFPRILRDLSLQYGKQVELVVQGAEVEVERLISGIIAEPLELLLRNAFKHGIESPQERQQEGKVSQGKIEFIITQTDESTIIKVSDDGCGIDIDEIRHQVEQSAAIAGMPSFSTMDMSDEQLISLILEPSFNLVQSNSEAGAKLSDVKKKLRKFGGTISVQSQRGKGTQFTLVLPNILSLIRVLLIDINQMCLAISSKMISEVIPIEANDNLSGEKENLLWRDRLLPIVRLNSFLRLNCRTNLRSKSTKSQQSTNLAESQKPDHAAPSFLVIQHENELFALQTDGCWHDQEATFHQIEGDIILSPIFLGTVILGSNQAIALLNPAELVKQCQRPNLPVLASHSIHSNVDDSGDRSFSVDTEPSMFDSLDATEQRSHEPENLESSVMFTSELTPPQMRRSLQPRVLIVESSANIRRYLAMTLTKSGFLTEQVQDGKEAISFLKDCLKISLNVAVVITDLEIHHTDGFNLLSSIRADIDLKNLPIIVLTDKTNESDRKLALDLGANAYFCKPYREQELINKLNQIISS